MYTSIVPTQSCPSILFLAHICGGYAVLLVNVFSVFIFIFSPNFLQSDVQCCSHCNHVDGGSLQWSHLLHGFVQSSTNTEHYSIPPAITILTTHVLWTFVFIVVKYNVAGRFAHAHFRRGSKLWSGRGATSDIR